MCTLNRSFTELSTMMLLCLCSNYCPWIMIVVEKRLITSYIPHTVWWYNNSLVVFIFSCRSATIHNHHLVSICLSVCSNFSVPLRARNLKLRTKGAYVTAPQIAHFYLKSLICGWLNWSGSFYTNQRDLL